jgi:predicted DCC family thiol-disulfide oxidoreductase YuxK
MSGPSGPVLLYDGVCGLCNGLVRFVLARDRARRFRFAPLQGEAAREMLRKWGRTPDALDTFYLVRDPGTANESVSSRGRAALLLFEEIGGAWRALARLLGVLPSSFLDFLYDAIARRRYRWFGKYDSCPLPPAKDRDRFLP